jgi:hypothetical protein
MAITTGIHSPRYRAGDTRAILDISIGQLRLLQTAADADSPPAGWRLRSLMDIFRLMLAIELAAHGLEVAEASRIAHEAPIGYGDDVRMAYEGSARTALAEQLHSELFGQTLVAQRCGDGWAATLHRSDAENLQLDKLVEGSAAVIRLRPLGERLMTRLRQYSLGEAA